jgi:hypothetical protein
MDWLYRGSAIPLDFLCAAPDFERVPQVGAVKRPVISPTARHEILPPTRQHGRGTEMTRSWGRMGYAMIENDNRPTNNSILSERQEYAFKAAVLILCAGILAMVLLSGTHEGRTADQCGQSDTYTACPAPSTPYPAWAGSRHSALAPSTVMLATDVGARILN